MNKPLWAGLVVVAVLAFATEKSAYAGVLEKAKSTGAITVGYVDDAMPFSFLNATGKPVGYSIDIANKIVEAVKAETSMPSLRVKRVAITAENRLALIEKGVVDFECTNTLHTVASENQVGFSASFFFQKTGAEQRKAYGCTYPKGDENFRKIANRIIVGDQTSGAAGKLYTSWFKAPPPEGMIALFIIPSDRPY